MLRRSRGWVRFSSLSAEREKFIRSKKHGYYAHSLTLCDRPFTFGIFLPLIERERKCLTIIHDFPHERIFFTLGYHGAKFGIPPSQLRKAARLGFRVLVVQVASLFAEPLDFGFSLLARGVNHPANPGDTLIAITASKTE